jgi:hypothetical protein
MVLRRLRQRRRLFWCGKSPDTLRFERLHSGEKRATAPPFPATTPGVNRLSASLDKCLVGGGPAQTSPRQAGKEVLARFARVI